MTDNEKILNIFSCKCGGGPIKSKKQGHKYKVRCKSCRRYTGLFLTEAEALKAWADGNIKVAEYGIQTS